ncbi:protein XA-1 isoform X1 [Xenopus tropicalis]|uniref:Anterior and ectodermic-specific protein n=1 Tax=Xenopus tropicalis TaxID=8364 RepID=A0A6I8Q7C4_XENTR|nr:protein XA-1 isoform X1 [Xenopus tropicalis]|eukprot:XP_004920522.1 PREDICTED: protein XA-1-like isoform X2 [Xenopus tropicalis]
MICYFLLLALVAPGWSHPPGRPGGDSASFVPPPPPPVSHDLIKGWEHPEEFRTGAPLPTKNLPNESENGRNKSDLHHEKAAPTGVPHHTGEVPHHTGEVPHHTGEVPHHTGEVPHHTGEVPPHTGEVPPHTGAHSGSGEISHPPRPDITHKSNEEKRPEGFRTGAPLPPKKLEHGRHRRDLPHGKAIPTVVPHDTEEFYSGSGEISHESSEEKRPEGFRTGAPLPPKKPEHGRHRRDLPHGKAIPTVVPHHTEEFYSGSGEISHESSEEKRPEGFRTGAPLPPKKPEHGRHRRDLQYGKAIPTVVPHDTEEFYSGSGEISPPPRHGHSGFIHIDESREGNDWA